MLKTPEKIRQLQRKLCQSAKHMYVKASGRRHARFEVAGDGKVLR
jgi:hypothetical protein